MANKILRYTLIGLHALTITWICYIAGNIPYSFGSEKQTLTWFNVISDWVTEKKHELPEDVVVINVSYDKQLININDQYGLPLGVTDITDRAKLSKLLHIIDTLGNYKFVFCDILFSPDFSTDSDSELYSLIAKMPRLAVTGGYDLEMIAPEIRGKAYKSTYNTTVTETEFVKYPLKINGDETIALHMWKELYGNSIKGNTFCTVSNGKLSRSSLFLDFPVRFSESHSEGHEKQWLNLGADILDVAHIIDLKSLFKDKIIFIGSCVEDDIHKTVAGSMPGLIINYNAFHALANNRAYVHISSLLLLFIIFYLITFLISYKKSIWDIVPAKIRTNSTIIKIFLTCVSYSSIFTILLFILYTLFGEIYDIFFIAAYFTTLETGVKLCNKYRNNQKIKVQCKN